MNKTIIRFAMNAPIGEPNSNGEVEVDLIPSGKWVKNGRKIKITTEDLHDMVSLFEMEPKGRVPINYAHRQARDYAAGWINKIWINIDRNIVQGLAKFTKKAAQHIADDELPYMSPEIELDSINKEGNAVGMRFCATALCIDPFFDFMNKVPIPINAERGWVFEETNDDKTVYVLDGQGVAMAEDFSEWDAKYIDNLPDSSFAVIEDGGEKDADGKTTPRSKRHFPIKDADGKLDAAHVRNALARIPQSPFGDKAKAKVEAAAKELKIGEAGEDESKKNEDKSDKKEKATVKAEAKAEEVNNDGDAKSEVSKKDKVSDMADKENDVNEVAARSSSEAAEFESKIRTLLDIPEGIDTLTHVSRMKLAPEDRTALKNRVVNAEALDNISRLLTASEKAVKDLERKNVNLQEEIVMMEKTAVAKELCAKAVRDKKIDEIDVNDWALSDAIEDPEKFEKRIARRKTELNLVPVGKSMVGYEHDVKASEVFHRSVSKHPFERLVTKCQEDAKRNGNDITYMEAFKEAGRIDLDSYLDYMSVSAIKTAVIS